MNFHDNWLVAGKGEQRNTGKQVMKQKLSLTDNNNNDNDNKNDFIYNKYK